MPGIKAGLIIYVYSYNTASQQAFSKIPTEPDFCNEPVKERTVEKMIIKDKDAIPEAEPNAAGNESIEDANEAASDNGGESEASGTSGDTGETGNTQEETNASQRIAGLEKTLEEEKDKYLRLIAEYDNYRKRSVSDRTNAVVDASVRTVVEVLGVIDNFERALSAECSDANYKKGIEMIFSQYKDVLAKLGVTEIEALDKPFDPKFHDAVNSVADENYAENTVCQVFQKGYMLGGKVVRPASVVVANP